MNAPFPRPRNSALPPLPLSDEQRSELDDVRDALTAIADLLDACEMQQLAPPTFQLASLLRLVTSPLLEMIDPDAAADRARGYQDLQG